MKSPLIAPLVILILLAACDKDDKPAITIHCDGLVTDTAGMGDNGRVYMPNAFTPNMDGKNDISRPILQNIAAVQFSIYDENSALVFTSSTIGQGWNTTISANTAIKYYYSVQATTSSGRKIGICGELYKLSCFPGALSRNSLFFEDQLTPFGFTGITTETMANCP